MSPSHKGSRDGWHILQMPHGPFGCLSPCAPGKNGLPVKRHCHICYPSIQRSPGKVWISDDGEEKGFVFKWWKTPRGNVYISELENMRASRFHKTALRLPEAVLSTSSRQSPLPLPQATALCPHIPKAVSPKSESSPLNPQQVSNSLLNQLKIWLFISSTALLCPRRLWFPLEIDFSPAEKVTQMSSLPMQSLPTSQTFYLLFSLLGRPVSHPPNKFC